METNNRGRIKEIKMKTGIITLFALLLRSPAHTTETALEATDAAVIHLLAPAPNRLLSRSEKARGRLVRNIVSAAEEYDVPHGVVTMTAFKEGSFRTNAVGKIGEVTTMQVHGDWLEVCKRKRMKLRTQAGQLRCGTYWLSKTYKKCGNWNGAITKYMSGRCVSKSQRTKKKVKERLALWETLQNLIPAQQEREVHVQLYDTQEYSDFDYTPMTYPERLTYEEIALHIQRYKHHMNRCGPKSGEQVVQRILIDGRAGTVAKVTTLNQIREPLALCVADVMRMMRFVKVKATYVSVRVIITF